MLRHEIAECYEEHFDYCVAVATSILQSKQDAEDAVQTVFSSLCKRPEGWQVETNLRSYLKGATKKECLNTLQRWNWKRKPTLRSTEGDLFALETYPDYSGCPVRHLINKELLEVIENALSQVDHSKERICWMLRYFEGYSNIEIARIITSRKRLRLKPNGLPEKGWYTPGEVGRFISNCNRTLQRIIMETGYSENL